jgi:small GTP-binding protein
MKWKRIALIGNPNCGKSTLFNRLTGLSQKTSNLPGTTVDSFEGKLQNNETTIVDLPGIYSLFTNTDYEKVVAKNLLGFHSRCLKLTSQFVVVVTGSRIGYTHCRNPYHA